MDNEGSNDPEWGWRLENNNYVFSFASLPSSQSLNDLVRQSTREFYVTINDAPQQDQHTKVSIKVTRYPSKESGMDGPLSYSFPKKRLRFHVYIRKDLLTSTELRRIIKSLSVVVQKHYQ